MGLSEILFYVLLGLIVFGIVFAIATLAENLIIPVRVFLCLGVVVLGALIGSGIHGTIVRDRLVHRDCMRQWHTEELC